MAEARESERPTVPHAPPPDLLTLLCFPEAPTRRLAPVVVERIVGEAVDAAWSDE